MTILKSSAVWMLVIGFSLLAVGLKTRDAWAREDLDFWKGKQPLRCRGSEKVSKSLLA